MVYLHRMNAAHCLRRWPSAGLDPGCVRRPGERRSTEPGNIVSLDVATNRNLIFEWKGVGAQARRKPAAVIRSVACSSALTHFSV